MLTEKQRQKVLSCLNQESYNLRRLAEKVEKIADFINYDGAIPSDCRTMRAGQTVVFAFPNNGTRYDQDKCSKLLKVGQKYILNHIDMGNSYTNVSLLGFPGQVFNSVMFGEYDEELQKFLD